MTEIRTIGARFGERDIEFKMYHDPSFQQCVNIDYYLQHGEFPEPEVMDVFARVIRPGDIVADVGANIGFHTLVMASLVGPNGLVYAIEPSPRNVEKLRANIDLNECSNVNVCECAAWRSGESNLMLHGCKDSGEDYVDWLDTVNSARIFGWPLKELIGLTIPRLIKIDAEGSEYNIMLGYQKFLHQVPFVVCELNSLALERAHASIQHIRDIVRNDIFQISPGRFPTLIPRNVTIKTSAQNCNVLITTLNLLSAAWPEIVL